MRRGILLALCAWPLAAQNAGGVLVVVNQSDSLSRRIGDYYVHRRHVPLKNVCRIAAPAAETIGWQEYVKIERAVGAYLRRSGLVEAVTAIVTTQGVPLRVRGPGDGPQSEACAVDSELALLYAKLHGAGFTRAGAVPNPFFTHRAERFGHPRFGMYMVTRLAGYDFADVQGIIDRALMARNRGKVVIDLKENGGGRSGDEWLRTAATLLPAGRVVFDESTTVVYGAKDVIGYASWGSNDPNRKRRFVGFQWLPGAIVTEFVSSNGRTFQRPPENWNISTWKAADRDKWFFGSPQTLAADYIHEGATGCSGHVFEPYLSQTPRPEYLFPAYLAGRTLAESYYLAIPSLSWQNIVIGDPLCRLQ
ncbi:MAG: TIGR03790 family protein [Bryobacteraceae bacterium]